MNEINNEYMEWLEKAIMKNGNFDTKSIELSNLTQKEKRNVKRLDDFYNIIDKHAKENGIDEYWYNDYSSYSIRYNDVFYNIVKENRDNTFMCIKRGPKEIINNYIDINNIIEKKEPKVYRKKS